MTRQRVTLKEVAAAAGVSYQTVSKVLNGQIQVSPETARRIEQAVRELGYHPSYTARSLRAQRSFTIGYSWSPALPGQANSITDLFLQSLLAAAEKEGYCLLCFPYHSDFHAYGELIDSGRVDGFVLSSVEYNDPRITLLQRYNFPFVAFGRSSAGLNFPWIDVDGAHGIELAVNHLLAQGHRRIGALAWPENSRVGNNRIEGYSRVLQSAGINPPSAWIERGEGQFAFGYQATLRLLDLPQATRPTAVVAFNDLMAAGALWAARERGLKVGREFGVTGFDDIPLAEYLDPPLTTLRQPVWEVGQQIIPLLMDVIRSGHDPEPRERLVAPELVVRASTLKE